MANKVLLINGPNINMLGRRETGIYGEVSYKDLCENLSKEATELDLDLEIFQSNHEGEIVDKIQSSSDARVILINPAAFTHTSVAIRDALLAIAVPFIELHISNTNTREEFRQHSFLSDVASGIITGFGLFSYSLALKAAAHLAGNDDLDARR